MRSSEAIANTDRYLSAAGVDLDDRSTGRRQIDRPADVAHEDARADLLGDAINCVEADVHASRPTRLRAHGDRSDADGRERRRPLEGNDAVHQILADVGEGGPD